MYCTFAEVIITRGVQVVTARVFEHREELGSISFSRIPALHRFILSLPQAATLELLGESLGAVPGVERLDGTEVIGTDALPNGVRVDVRDRRDGSRPYLGAVSCRERAPGPRSSRPGERRPALTRSHRSEDGPKTSSK